MGNPLNRLQQSLADRYAIERELGRGGMAVVMLARDLKHRRQVAIKVLRPELSESLGTVRQLRGLPWWLARRDTASLARFGLRAEQEARTQESAHGKLQGRYLHAAATAYLALARADSVRALRRFQSIPDTLCLENDCYYEKLIEARLLTSQGQARQAGAVLDRWVWSGGGPLFVLGVLEQARIAEGLGERDKATQAY